MGELIDSTLFVREKDILPLELVVLLFDGQEFLVLFGHVHIIFEDTQFVLEKFETSSHLLLLADPPEVFIKFFFLLAQVFLIHIFDDPLFFNKFPLHREHVVEDLLI